LFIFYYFYFSIRCFATLVTLGGTAIAVLFYAVPSTASPPRLYIGKFSDAVLSWVPIPPEQMLGSDVFFKIFCLL